MGQNSLHQELRKDELRYTANFGKKKCDSKHGRISQERNG
jgi:hypothetical protein